MALKTPKAPKRKASTNDTELPSPPAKRVTRVTRSRAAATVLAAAVPAAAVPAAATVAATPPKAPREKAAAAKAAKATKATKASQEKAAKATAKKAATAEKATQQAAGEADAAKKATAEEEVAAPAEQIAQTSASAPASNGAEDRTTEAGPAKEPTEPEPAVKEHLRQTEDKLAMFSSAQNELMSEMQTRFEKFTDAQKGFEDATMKRLDSLDTILGKPVVAGEQNLHEKANQLYYGLKDLETAQKELKTAQEELRLGTTAQVYQLARSLADFKQDFDGKTQQILDAIAGLKTSSPAPVLPIAKRKHSDFEDERSDVDSGSDSNGDSVDDDNDRRTKRVRTWIAEPQEAAEEAGITTPAQAAPPRKRPVKFQRQIRFGAPALPATGTGRPGFLQTVMLENASVTGTYQGFQHGGTPPPPRPTYVASNTPSQFDMGKPSRHTGRAIDVVPRHQQRLNLGSRGVAETLEKPPSVEEDDTDIEIREDELQSSTPLITPATRRTGIMGPPASTHSRYDATRYRARDPKPQDTVDGGDDEVDYGNSTIIITPIRSSNLRYVRNAQNSRESEGENDDEGSLTGVDEITLSPDAILVARDSILEYTELDVVHDEREGSVSGYASPSQFR